MYFNRGEYESDDAESEDTNVETTYSDSSDVEILEAEVPIVPVTEDVKMDPCQSCAS